jgi:subtilisin family serine protease
MNVRRSLLAVLVCCVIALSGQAHAISRSTQALADTTLLVRFQPDTTNAERAAVVERLNGTIVDTIPALHIGVVQIKPTADGAALRTATTLLDQDPAVVYTAPNMQFRVADETEQTGGGQRVLLPLAASMFGWVPNDIHYTKQAGAWQQISAPAGWNLARGSTGTVIAIIDTGVHLAHPDLRAKILGGYDFVDNDTQAEDGHGHGTHVAGLAAAQSNNTTGVAGTCPNCKIMPVRVLDNGGFGDLASVAQGLVWAADHGAHVINMSLTGAQETPVLNDALEYAWSRGALPVCAAGNQSSNNPRVYPAAHPRCLTVAATNMNDERASYSNYGPWVALAAPGDGLYSTFMRSDGSGGFVSAYEYDTGTSMAAPLVAGAASILVERGLTNDQLRQRLCSTADKIAQTGTYWQCGRLNLYRALNGR